VVVSELDNLKHVNGKMIVDGVATKSAGLQRSPSVGLNGYFPTPHLVRFSVQQA
jgi:hypothetical protein